MRENPVWHFEVLPADAKNTFESLGKEPSLRNFYLAGGTALALQWGHRQSVDLDFFTEDAVNEDRLLQSLENLSGIKVVSKAPETLHVHIGSTKVSGSSSTCFAENSLRPRSVISIF